MRGLLALAACAACARSMKVVDKQCTDDSMCPMSAPHCDANFTCTGCVADIDCAGYPTTPHCLTGETCVACVDATQCANSMPICDATMHACRTCQLDSECPSQVCDPDSGACVSAAMILYAAANGPDTASCLQTSPCSLQRALSIMDPLRPIVRMLPGTYTQAIAVTVTPSQPVSIVATGALLAGTVPSTSYGVYVDNSNTLAIRGLTIAIGGSNLVYCHAPPAQVSTLTLRAVTLQTGYLATQNCQLAMLQSDFHLTAVLLNDGTTADLERSWFQVVQPTSSSTMSVKIVNSLLSTLQLSMLTQPANATVTVSYSTFYGATESCAYSNLARGVIFVDDIFAAPGATDSITGTGCTFDTNVAFPQSSAIGINTIAMDPKLVNPAAGDFHLQLGSPAIGAARPTMLDPTVDYAGTPRPATGLAIGAYEYKAP